MKKLMSVILASLILICPLSGFASEVGETLEWYFCSDIENCNPWIYSYRGDISLGETNASITDEEHFTYYTFNAENAGYYYVECNDYEIDWFGFPEGTVDGKAIREAENYYVSTSSIEKKVVFKINAGETVFGIDFSNDADPEDICKVNIEYLGSEMTGLSFDEDAFDDLIIDCDLYNNDVSCILTDIGVVFSNNKTIIFPNEWVELVPEDYEWKKGDNNATAYFLDIAEIVDVTACELTDVVTDVEFLNIDDYNEVSTFYNQYIYEDIYGAELVFTLADGEKISINTNYDEYVKINGRNYYVYAYYGFNGAEDVEINISFGGTSIKTFECTASKTSYVDGCGMLFSDIGTNIKDSFFYSRIALSELFRMYDVGDFEETLSDVSYYFRNSFSSFTHCFSLIKMFIQYYF